MGLDLDSSEGQTPIDENEKDGLLIKTITTRADLNEFEQLGVEKAVEWSRRRKFSVEQVLSEEFVKDLHRVMFEEIWKWAGEFRRTNKNLGVDKNETRIERRKLLDDGKYWAGSPPPRYSHPERVALKSATSRRMSARLQIPCEGSQGLSLEPSQGCFLRTIAR